MNYKVNCSSSTVNGKINLTSSKSESNRVLIIKSLCDKSFDIFNLAEAQDTQTLSNVLSSLSSKIDIGPAGTAMRFLTAFLSTVSDSSFTLTGSDRMLERPIYPLVNSLKELGANISYLGEEGYPPLRILGGNLISNPISIKGDISSQFITALLLIAPILPDGLELNIEGELVSIPYIKMTLEIMNYFGINSSFKDNKIFISSGKYISKNFYVEGDWSSASYLYSVCALSESSSIIISGLKKKSLQGDSEIQSIMKSFNVKTEFFDNSIKITKLNKPQIDFFEYDFSDCPDLAQTVAVVCVGLNIKACLTGLKTLKIKETDRILALVNEFSKLGVKSYQKNYSLIIEKSDFIKTNVSIATYEDHRMAMSFAPLAMKLDSISIMESDVVKKSYPNYWNDLISLGFSVLEE